MYNLSGTLTEIWIYIILKCITTVFLSKISEDV